MTILIGICGFLISGALSIGFLHAGAAFLVWIIGEEKCLSPNAINGCDWWPMSQFISTAAVVALANRWGFWSLLTTPIGPLLCMIVAVLKLRFGERQARAREFEVKEGHVIALCSGKTLHPRFVEALSRYFQTGPGTGYTLYTLRIHCEEGQVLSNGYVSTVENGRTLTILTQELRCQALDLALVTWDSTERFRSVTLGQEWVAFLCGDLSKMEGKEIEWWRQWLQPAFGWDGVRQVPKEEIQRRLEALEMSYGDTLHADKRIDSDCSRLKKLIETAQHPITLCTTKVHHQKIEAARGNGWVVHKTEDGEWIGIIEHRTRKQSAS